ncbi:uncharacterized protein V1516DRAFT_676597 [Lipomyces oligophaga]|uniref:uncharacterized protein n=1 Tax=Lipomyces oligophaga TaxID=45792 RepID=UPI0034CF169C
MSNEHAGKHKPVPLWIISPQEEQQVGDRQAKFARSKCAAVLTAFSECQKDRMFTAGWYCSKEKNEMMDCMLHFMGVEYRDQFTTEFIKEKQAIRREILREQNEGIQNGR